MLLAMIVYGLYVITNVFIRQHDSGVKGKCLQYT